MKKMLNYILCLIVILFLFFPIIDANPTIWSNSPKTSTKQGEIFELRFEIESDEKANYSIILDPGTKFSIVDGNNNMTKEIPIDETRTFIFNMQIDEELENGKYVIYYDALKNNVKFKSEGKAYVRAGQQAPGFEIVLFISAIIVAFVLFRRRNHN